MKYIITILLMISSLYAHKLYILADDDGQTLHVKSYFTKSAFCKDCKVEIFDINDKLLYEGKTDKNGTANFPFISKNIQIAVTASMGHYDKISYESENEVVSNSESISENVEENESFKKILMALAILALIFGAMKLVVKK